MIAEDIHAFAAALPRSGALMGLDLGTRTIGVAVSDGMRQVASPLETVPRKKFTQDAARLLQIAGPRGLVGIVLGLPRNMDGSEGPRCQSTRAFARNLSGLTDLPSGYWGRAAVHGRRRTRPCSRRIRPEYVAPRSSNHVAAAVILQGLLDRLRASRLRRTAPR
jgi:RNAse H-fold protein YqgF